MATEIPIKELKLVVKSLNTVLKSQKKPAIKTVGSKKEVIFESFLDNVTDFLEDKKEGLLPDDVIDFYNAYAAEDEEIETEEVDETEEVEEKPAKKTTAKKRTRSTGKKTTAKKTTAKKTTAKKTTAKKDTTDKGPGVVQRAVEVYMDSDNKTTKAIVDVLESEFPGRNIASTVSNVVCVMGHVSKKLD